MESYDITHVGRWIDRPDGDNVPHFCATRFGATYYLLLTTYCLLLTTDYLLPAMFCSTRFGTNQDNPSDPSDMNEDGPVRDQRASRVARLTQGSGLGPYL
eukprot:scaffold4564_cov52-Phaeocystis_antarctica.AAC.2